MLKQNVYLNKYYIGLKLFFFQLPQWLLILAHVIQILLPRSLLRQVDATARYQKKNNIDKES